MATLPLGQSTQCPDQYDPSLLFPIPRIENRKKLGLKEGQSLPFVGVDIWNAFELAGLTKKVSLKLLLQNFKFLQTLPI
jgi:7-cyano-7-deazaguanine reductase